MAGTIITIVSLTGTILVYRDEIDHALNPEIFWKYTVPCPLSNRQKKKVSYSAIGRIRGVNRITVSQFAKTRGLNKLTEK